MLKYLSRLAWNNLKTNHRLYLPFGIVVTMVVAFTYIFTSLALNPMIDAYRGGVTIKSVLGLGIFIVALVAAAILFYGNNFTSKNRMREWGLYSILGVERQHLLIMTGIELSYFAIITVALGVILGIVFDQLSYAALQYLMKLPVELVSTFQWRVVGNVIGIFFIAFILLIGINGLKMLRLQPMAILRESKAGEKKVKFVMLKAVVGFILLGAGYYIANVVDNPVAAVGTFFIAVLLVIAGTFLLFEAGIVMILKLLQRNPRYYYQSTRMLSISNLIFRMKQNAAGLATICILSTMTLVVVIGASALYLGSERMITLQHPADLTVHTEGQFVNQEELREQAMRFIETKQLNIETQVTYQLLGGFGEVSNNHVNVMADLRDFQNLINLNYVQVMDQQLYEQISGKAIQLEKDEVLVFTSKASFDVAQPLMVGEKNFKIRDIQTDSEFLVGKLPLDFTYINGQYLLLVVKELDSIYSEELAEYMTYHTGINFQLKDSFKEQVEKISDNGELDDMVFYSGKANYAEQYYAINGVALFIGVLLSILFSVAMILTMYFKQMTEGFEDQKRFETLHQIGLDQVLIQKTIRYQVLTVFLLPIILAIIHMGFAFKIITSIMMLIGGISSSILLPIVLMVVVLFIVFYLMVYYLTAKNYTRIVTKKE